MKINEKNLYTFANSKPVDKEGFLQFKRDIKFQRRWFVLKGNLLFYFDKKGDKEPLGLLLLEGCTVELTADEDTQQYCFQLVFHGENDRTYYMGAQSQTEMESWMKALTCASYDYMKLMVGELQRQLEEIDSRNKGHSTKNKPAPKAPPRQRQNPFNKPTSSTTAIINPTTEAAKIDPESNEDTDLTFESIHQDIGSPIQENIQRSENSVFVI
ncbi:CLUMA_CG011927, isoform A [Clunio marinus]|uniref:CLUMA_CG011927, isoform A n=1 Tax=Clunio marinus TaxID=568069 RepID=A0A1J1IFP7_9DIPT|nr:CLUMA_CG011927, isoform A [Clunio marinus]